MDRAALIRSAVLALGLVVSGVSLAQPSAVSWPSVVLKYATDGTPLLQPRVPLASTAAGGGAATLNASQRLAIGSASANLNLTRNVPVANLAKVARVAARALGPVALAGLVYEGLQYLSGEWVKPEDGAGTLANPQGCWKESGGTVCYSSAADLCSYRGGLYGGSLNIIPASSGWVMDGGLKRWDCKNNGSGSSYGTAFLAPADECAVGSVYAGGACTAAGTIPATDSDLEISFQQGLIASPSLAGQVLDAALASSAARAELLADAMGITGPASVDGGTKTSTKVDTAGMTTIQTATTYNLSYSGDTVTLTQTNVETVTDPASNVTTTTTTTEAPTGEPPPPEEQSKFCEEFPDASACQELGEHEPDGELGEEQRALSWSPELSAAGSCPAPITLSIMGSTQSLEWSSVCDLASGVRPVVIALAWLSAAVFVFGVGRVTAS